MCFFFAGVAGEKKKKKKNIKEGEGEGQGGKVGPG